MPPEDPRPRTEDSDHPHPHGGGVSTAANAAGWIGVLLVTAFATFWSFWGIIEAFHEGWCKPELWMRVLQLLAYLSHGISLCLLCVVGIRWPRFGAALFMVIGVVIAALIFLTHASFSGFILFSLTALPVVIGCVFLFGRPRPKSLAYAIAVIPPVLTVLVCGIEPAIRVSNRFDDGNRDIRLVEGNGVCLLWAPAGPGWAREGNITWADAAQWVRYLTDDGLTLAEEPQEIWRLPTREEVVRSLTRGNRNAGGTLEGMGQAHYQITPDKESPLWDRYAPLIYLWTSEAKDDQSAWIVVYHGGIYAKPKGLGSSSLGFRAVREPPSGSVAP